MSLADLVVCASAGSRERERKNGGERSKTGPAVVAKSASPSEKPRQAWGLTGLIDMQRECLCKFYWWWNTELNPEPLLQPLGEFDGIRALISEK